MATHYGRTLLSVGSINLDIQVRGKPAAGETLKARDYLRAGGGKGANAAVFAGRLEANTALVGRVGDDAFAKLALRELRAARVDLDGVLERPGKDTGNAVVIVQDDGTKMIVLAPNANQAWEANAEDVVTDRVNRCGPGSVVVTDLDISRRVVRAALSAARAQGLMTVLDPAPATEMRDDLYALCDFITPNPREAEQLTGVTVRSEKDAARAGHILLDRGVRHACIKLPHGGAALVDAQGVWATLAPKVNVVDTTGAGDAFAAGLGAALLKGCDAREAMVQAVAAASLAVTRYGAQFDFERSEFETLLERTRQVN
ncbi:MAG: PfkB family carbohydrate kinase [Myxococcales bacterium]